MTKEQAREIENKGPLWIAFYYGKVAYGFLQQHNTSNEWYFIEKWREYKEAGFKQDWLTLPENAETVHLEMIEFADGPLPQMKDEDSNVTSSDHDETILIVLGAGASYDFNGKEGFRFPLTAELFNERFADVRSLYPGVEKEYHSLAKITDIEAYFERKWKLITTSYNPKLLNRLVSIQFYLQQLLLRMSIFHHTKSPNYYQSLIQQMNDYIALKNNRVRFVVVNFNYDILFERALNVEMNYSFHKISDYDDPKRYISLFKPHGSSDWLRYNIGDSNVTDQPKARYMSELAQIPAEDNPRYNLYHIYKSTSENINILSNPDNFETLGFDPLKPITEAVPIRGVGSIRSEIRVNKRFFPHLLLPYRDKDDFLIPDSQRRRIETYLQKCSRAYCIGWKGNESKFIDILTDKKIHFSWITGTDGQKEIQNGEANRLISGSHTFYNKGFAQCMIDVKRQKWWANCSWPCGRSGFRRAVWLWII
jgi:hypothetical protein